MINGELRDFMEAALVHGDVRPVEGLQVSRAGLNPYIHLA